MGPPGNLVNPQGWAIECRINAEDPYQNFMPSTGTITNSLTPKGPGVRVDSGVYTGSEITPYYDSMIAKLIVSGETRSEAIQRMRRALSEYMIMGLKHNIPFHIKLFMNIDFMRGQFDTQFVESDRFSMEKFEEDPTHNDLEIAAIAATLHAHQKRLKASRVVRVPQRDTSNWKWISRWERMQR